MGSESESTTNAAPTEGADSPPPSGRTTDAPPAGGSGLRPLAEFRDASETAGHRSPLNQVLANGREHWIWVMLGALLAGLWAMFAASHLLGLHFRAWEVLGTRPSTDALAQAVRGPIMGWLEPAVLVVGMVAGAVGAAVAVAGRWKPIAFYFGSMTVVMVAAEITQGLGQDESRPQAVDHVPISGLVLIGFIILAELVLLVAARPRRS